jgi:predicted NAD/FAD-binding protein
VNARVQSVARKQNHVIITTSDGRQKKYDRVILATHADQAVNLLEDPTSLESELLTPFIYQKNIATLHTDESIMPTKKSAWSAWNYIVQEMKGKLVATTAYHMNALQRVSEKKQYFVSINDPGMIDRAKVIREIAYEHPIFTPETAMAQKRLHQLNENGTTYFCGSYFRFGFHEDALASAVHVCERILGGNPWDKSKRVENPVAVEFS